jgi:hypothetical protein
MIEIFISFTNDRVFEKSSWGGHSEIKNEIIDWLIENVLDWDYVRLFYGCSFVFENLNEAMLFKLVWF